VLDLTSETLARLYTVCTYHFTLKGAHTRESVGVSVSESV